MTQAIDPFLSVEMLKRNQHPPMVALKHGGINKIHVLKDYIHDMNVGIYVIFMECVVI